MTADFTFAPLTPAAFLDRSGTVFADRPAIVDGELTLTYGEFAARARKLADALRRQGLESGDRVAALCANSHVMLELHDAVPRAGLALVPLNIRLSVGELTYIVEHSGAALLVATAEFAEMARDVSARAGARLVLAETGADDYEELIAQGRPGPMPPVRESELLGISYTSGTTGRPKGVMYHHRGAYLQALAMAYHCALGPDGVYLWTLPMFHCHGWCFTWGVTAAGATHVCTRTTDPADVWRLLRTHGVSHFCGAPTVLTMLANSPAADAGPALPRTVDVMTGGSPPSPTLLARMSALGMKVTHLYGLTETYGPVAINQWQPAWSELDEPSRVLLSARQGVGNVISAALRVVDDDGADVPADGQTVGEIVCRGNNLMLGYYRDDEATKAVTVDGCFRTGDLGVMHPDGYVEIRDRGKDIIISGGENIASVEVERVIDAHPAVLESAVVSRPDDVWGEVPVAFVTLRPDMSATADELIAWVRDRLAHFKAPKQVTFGVLPKTSTGKIQKNVLRAELRA